MTIKEVKPDPEPQHAALEESTPESNSGLQAMSRLNEEADALRPQPKPSAPGQSVPLDTSAAPELPGPLKRTEQSGSQENQKIGAGELPVLRVEDGKSASPSESGYTEDETAVPGPSGLNPQTGKRGNAESGKQNDEAGSPDANGEKPENSLTSNPVADLIGRSSSNNHKPESGGSPEQNPGKDSLPEGPMDPAPVPGSGPQRPERGNGSPRADESGEPPSAKPPAKPHNAASQNGDTAGLQNLLTNTIKAKPEARASGFVETLTQFFGGSPDTNTPPPPKPVSRVERHPVGGTSDDRTGQTTVSPLDPNKVIGLSNLIHQGGNSDTTTGGQVTNIVREMGGIIGAITSGSRFEQEKVLTPPPAIAGPPAVESGGEQLRMLLQNGRDDLSGRLMRAVMEQFDNSNPPPVIKEKPTVNVVQTIAQALSNLQIENTSPTNNGRDPQLEDKDMQELIERVRQLVPLQVTSRQSESNDPQTQLKPPSIPKFEMQSNQPADENKQRLNQSNEAKVQNLLAVLSELKPVRISTESSDLNFRPASQHNNNIAAVVSAQLAARQELPLLPNIMKAQDIVIELKRASLPEQAKTVFDPSNPNLVSARRQILVEAMSLKDLIAANKGDVSAVAGIKGLRTLQDPMLGIRQPAGSLVTKPDAMPAVKGAEGKFDPSLIGLKGAELTEAGRMAGKFTPLNPGIVPDAKALGTDRKDVIEKKDDSKPLPDKDLIPPVVPISKVKDSKIEEKDDKDKKGESKEQETRRKYIVREGDTLESIAEKIIGDRRFSVLLEIINRGYIRYAWEGSLKKAVLRVGQTIWLPSANEVKVHRSLFFTKSADKENQKAIVRTGNNAEPTEVVVDSDLSCDSLPVLEVGESDKTEPRVKTSKQVQSDFSTKPIGALELAGKECAGGNSWTVVQEFLQQIRQIGSEALKTESSVYEQVTPLAPEDDFQETSYLNESVRLTVRVSDHSGDLLFCASLERELRGEWHTVAYYESVSGRSVRYLCKSNGARSAFHLNLPQAIVQQMALKDLSRNWQHYSQEFMTEKFLRAGT